MTGRDKIICVMNKLMVILIELGLLTCKYLQLNFKARTFHVYLSLDVISTRSAQCFE